ncbi:MAG: hypothetical protein ACO38K_09020 [Ilumatobacteraceae bacterium]
MADGDTTDGGIARGADDLRTAAGAVDGGRTGAMEVADSARGAVDISL